MIQPHTSLAAHSEQQSPNRNVTQPTGSPRFGSEIDVEALTGLSRKTLQKDRQAGRQRFPWYKSGKRVLYDLNEVEAIIRSTARGGAFVQSVGPGVEAAQS